MSEMTLEEYVIRFQKGLITLLERAEDKYSGEELDAYRNALYTIASCLDKLSGHAFEWVKKQDE